MKLRTTCALCGPTLKTPPISGQLLFYYAGIMLDASCIQLCSKLCYTGLSPVVSVTNTIYSSEPIHRMKKKPVKKWNRHECLHYSVQLITTRACTGYRAHLFCVYWFTKHYPV